MNVNSAPDATGQSAFQIAGTRCAHRRCQAAAKANGVCQSQRHQDGLVHISAMAHAGRPRFDKFSRAISANHIGVENVDNEAVPVPFDRPQAFELNMDHADRAGDRRCICAGCAHLGARGGGPNVLNGYDRCPP